MHSNAATVRDAESGVAYMLRRLAPVWYWYFRMVCPLPNIFLPVKVGSSLQPLRLSPHEKDSPSGT